MKHNKEHQIYVRPVAQNQHGLDEGFNENAQSDIQNNATLRQSVVSLGQDDDTFRQSVVASDRYDAFSKHDNASFGQDNATFGQSVVASKQDNASSKQYISSHQHEDYTPPYFDKRKRRVDISYLALISIFILIMLCGGFNFMPLIAVLLGLIAGVFILIRVLLDKGIGIYLLSSFFVSILGTFVFFLIWGAESFGRVLSWNLLLSATPIALALLLIFSRKLVAKKALKATTALISLLMACSVLFYIFFMNLRVRPTVESLQAGHQEYLNSLKTTKINNNSPNVLVILMDDLAYSDISSYSYLGNENATIKTPNIDSIAANGIMMDNFYASAPVCTPSRFSMLTGRYASRGYLDNVIFPTTYDANPYSITHLVNPYQFAHNVDGLLGDEITYAEALQSVGYNTACIGKWNLGDYGEYLPTNQGFDYFYGSYYVNDMTPYNWVSERNGVATEVKSHRDNLDQSDSTKLFTAEMVNFISSSIDNDEKFLAYYTSPWPHYPIFSGEKFDKTDDSYIDCIEEFDTYLGDIIDTLKNKGVYDDTLIFFTSDNGPGREGVTGTLRGRKNTTFDGGMKVPLIASYPNGGLGRGTAIENHNFSYVKDGTKINATTKKIDASAMMFDIFPTILKYVGINQLPSDRMIDGRSMFDLWQATVPTSTRIHSALFYQKKGKCQGIQMPVEVDGVVYDFKYYDKVRTENSAFIDQNYKNYLFNLDTDPAEGYNISMTYSDVAQKLNAELNKFRMEMKTNRRGIL